PGKITCALIVIEAWAFVKGKPPSHNNEDAQEACEAYWLACGGQSSAKWQWQLKLARADRSARRAIYSRSNPAGYGIALQIVSIPALTSLRCSELIGLRQLGPINATITQ